MTFLNKSPGACKIGPLVQRSPDRVAEICLLPRVAPKYGQQDYYDQERG